MTRSKKKILLDVTPLCLDYCGIRSDASVICKMLLDSELLNDITFLGGSVTSSPCLGNKSTTQAQAKALAKLEDMSSIEAVPIKIKILVHLLKILNDFKVIPNPRYNTISLSEPLLYESFIRFFFGKEYISSEILNQILKCHFTLTNLSQEAIIKKTLFRVFGATKLNTKGHKVFFTHQDHMPVAVSKGTQYIVRYHDSIPILHPDLMKMATASITYRYRALAKAVSLGTHFVCNSKQTESELIKLFPELQGRTDVIPPVISPFPAPEDSISLEQIVSRYLFTGLMKDNSHFDLQTLIKEFMDPSLEYVLTIAPLDPKKNISRLIEAFQILRNRYKRKTKLVICGGKGWKNKNVKEKIAASMKNCEVVWLKGVPYSELSVLMKFAKAFVFVSLTEGFGIPPIEAMSCGIPVLSSDIPVFKETQKDAALYCNPYDADDIAEKLNTLLQLPDDERQNIISKGKNIAKQYSFESVQPLWIEFFKRFLI